MIRDGASAPDVTPLLARARADLVERIPSVRLKVDRTVPGVSVAVDGAQVDSDLGTPLSLDPGTHSIAAHAATHEPFELSLTLAEGDDRVVDLLLRPSPPPPTQKPVPITRARPRNAAGHTESTGIGPREAVLVTEAALTLAGAALGVTYLLKRGSATERHDATARELPDDKDSCANPTGTAAVTCARLRDSLEERRDDGLIATWGFVGGGVSAAAFVATWLLWPSGASRGTSGGAQLTPSPRGFVLSGHF